jgi:integrase/recombinase XerD
MDSESIKSGETQTVDEFLKHAKNRKYSIRTIRQYEYTLKKLIPFLEARNIHRLQDVTGDDLEAFQRHLQETGLCLGSQENIMRATRKFFRCLEASGRLFADPTASLVMPRRCRSMIIVPTEEEMGKLLAQPDIKHPIGIRDRALMEVAYGCGLRRTELAKLSIHDPDPEQGRLRVNGKGGKQRIVPLGKQALHWLNVYLKESRPKLLKDRFDEERLWITEQRTPMEGGSIRQQVRCHVERAGIRTPMNLHSLRKACATHMLAHGAHPVQIQMLLGHASLRHLGRYLSVTIREMKKTHSQNNPGR